MSGVILGCNVDTARWYGRIAAQLKTIGRPIPQNDIWIAAIARQYELTMLTRDKHFENVDGLVVESWL
jgi:tRNA(fMet)-specific endonuclease VapC